MADWLEDPPKWQESPVQSGHFGRIQVSTRPFARSLVHPVPGGVVKNGEHLDGCGCPRPQGPRRRRRDGCEQRYRLRNGSRFRPRARPHDPGCRNTAAGEERARAAGADGAGGEHGGPATRLGRNLESVQRFADGFMRRHDRLDVLVNNAGVGFIPTQGQSTASSGSSPRTTSGTRPDRPTVRASRVHPGRRVVTAQRAGLPKKTVKLPKKAGETTQELAETTKKPAMLPKKAAVARFDAYPRPHPRSPAKGSDIDSGRLGLPRGGHAGGRQVPS